MARHEDAGLIDEAIARGRGWAVAVAAFALLSLALLAPPDAPAQTAEPAVEAAEQASLAFAPNTGQTDERVRYLAQGAGSAFFFADDKAVLSFPATGSRDGLALELRFVGANPDAELEAGERAAGIINRITDAGGDAQAGVPTYRQLTYRDLWPNIDLVFRGDGGELTYEFHLRPGADASDIQLDYAGADRLSVGPAGGLVISTPAGELRQGAPAGEHVAYTLRGTGHHGFALAGGSDHGHSHMIRARLAYSTFVGGSGSDAGHGVAVDDRGNVYVTGQTASADFPTTAGVYDAGYNQNVDAFVTKFDRRGALVYSTFVGGRAFDSGNAIAVDRQGAAYIAGFTGSIDFPTTPAAFDPTHNGGSEAFVTKLSPSGAALEYSSYLGAGGFSFEGANGIAVDDRGSAYVTGFAGAGDFPTTPGAFDVTHNGRNDVYVTKFDPSGSSLAYSTFVGGTLSDTGNAIAVDDRGSAYVTGFTASADFPTTADAFDTTHEGGNDAFVAKLDPAGSALVYSTFAGGTGDDSGRGIAVDENGTAAHLTGSTTSSDFPTTWRAFDRSYNGAGDAFVTTLTRSGSALASSTFLGGSAADAGLAIAVDGDGNAAHVAGSTDSSDFPTTWRAFDRSYNGGGDAFLTTPTRAGSALAHSTFLGGTGTDTALAIAVDDRGRNAFLTGSTTSADYPVARASDGTYNGSGDGILTRIALTAHQHHR